MNNGDNVKFVSCTSAKFSTITKQDNTIYYISDTHNIYLGSVNYTDVSSLDSRITALETWKNGIQDGDSLSYGNT